MLTIYNYVSFSLLLFSGCSVMASVVSSFLAMHTMQFLNYLNQKKKKKRFQSFYIQIKGTQKKNLY